MLSNTPQRLVEMVRGITSESVDERHIWADVPGYWCDNGELNCDEGPVLAAVLAWATLIETHIVEVREGFLSSLSSLIVLDLVPTEVLELVTSGLSRDSLDISEVEFYGACHQARRTPQTFVLELSRRSGVGRLLSRTSSPPQSARPAWMSSMTQRGPVALASRPSEVTSGADSSSARATYAAS